MGQTKTRLWDPAEHLETAEDMAAYLNAALEDGDVNLIMAVLGDIARAKRMALATQETMLVMNSPHEPQSPNGNLDFATVLDMVNALGLRLQAIAAPTE